jgi:BlaI family penicillinase repressor
MFLKQFAEFNSICIQCHDSPDADAMGAAFGLYAYFMNLGKKVNLIYAGEHQITKPSLKLMVEHLGIPIRYVNEMPEPKPPYTSVASVVRNLEKKKFLSPFKLGNSIQYHVLVKESDYKRSFMNGVVSNYFTGSYKEMVSFFVRDRKISKKELEDLINIIEDEES